MPPYIIFHDGRLLKILNHRPGSLRKMGEISGIGQAKLAKYGDEYLQILENEANGAV